MARRPHHEEELPFVALMDTMTNVVGVLIIVLVMIGIGLARSVNKVLSELPPVTVEEHVKLQKEVAASQPKDDPRKVAEESARLQQEVRKMAETLQTLELSKEKQNIKVVDLDDLNRQLAERQQERDLQKAGVDKLLAELDKLKAQLDTTPVYQPPPAMVVKLPNPRAMPDKAVLQHFLVAGGRIVYTNDEEFSKLVEQTLKTNESALAQSRETVKGPDGNPLMVKDKLGRLTPQRKVIYDAKKLAEFFPKQRLGSRDIKVEVAPAPNSPRIPLKLSPMPGGGETIEQARILTSAFQGLVRKFKPEPRTVIWFHVYKDSLGTYLAARELADQLGLPVGWDLYGLPVFVHYLPPEYAVDFTPPPAPAGAPSAVTIAPPKATLD